MLKRLRDLVEFAYENVALYRKLYQKMPDIGDMDDFGKLPYLTKSHFALCSIQDVLSDLDEAAVILPPIENKAIFPFPRLESSYDRDCRYRIFNLLMEQVGVADESSFLIITDSKHSYYCGEIASNLLYYRHPTWMMLLRDHSDDEIRAWMDKFEPDYLLVGLGRIPEAASHWGVESIFTINQYDRDLSSQGHISHFDIYALAEFGWIAVRPPGGQYMYPTEYFYLEADPRDDILTLTALESWLQPFIRYRSPDRGKMLKNGVFQVTYMGEH